MITCFSDFRYVDLFWSYICAQIRIVKNRAEFWTFLSSHILLGQFLHPVQNSFLRYHP